MTSPKPIDLKATLLRIRRRRGVTLAKPKGKFQNLKGRPATYYTYNKETRTAGDWAERLGLAARAAFYYRLRRHEANPNIWPLTRVFQRKLQRMAAGREQKPVVVMPRPEPATKAKEVLDVVKDIFADRA